MELRHLKYFIAVAEELNFTKAAERLNISQPPLSKQIKDLEFYLDQKLFIRNNKKVKLTDAGMALLFKSYKILKEVESVKPHLKTIQNKENPEISIGFSETALNDLIHIVKKFKEKHPYAKIRLHKISSPKQVSALKNNEIDIGLICSPLMENNFSTFPLNEQTFSVVLPSTHNLAKIDGPINIKEMKSDTFMITPRNVSPAYYDVVFSIFNKNNFFPESTITAYSSTANIALITAGLGVAVMPYSMNNFFSQYHDIIFKEIINSSTIETSLLWNPNKQSTLINNAIDIAKNYGYTNLF